MDERLSAAVHAYVGAINRRDVSALVEVLTEDVVLDAGPQFPASIEGRETVCRTIESYWRALPELTVVLRSMFAARDEVVAVVDLVATLGHEPPTAEAAGGWKAGRRVGWDGAFRFAMNGDDRIRLIRLYWGETATRWFTEIPGQSAGAPLPPSPR
ncbi:MAG: nuclear transport factor 2 family protein [Thermoplasmata archaeon]